MKQVMAFGAATTQGDWPVQEDAYWIEPVWGSYVIGDGMGGKDVGDIASSKLVKRVGADLVARLRKGAESEEELKGHKRLSAEENQMRSAMVAANAELMEQNKGSDPDQRAGVSLLAAQFLPSGRVILGNAGACGAVVLRGGNAISILSPQTFAISQGNVSGAKDERFGSDFSLSGLGFFAELEPEIRTCHFHQGDYLLLFSAGFVQGTDAILKQAAVMLEAGVAESQTLEQQTAELLALSGEAQASQRNASIVLIDCASRLFQ